MIGQVIVAYEAEYLSDLKLFERMAGDFRVWMGAYILGVYIFFPCTLAS
jgi:hypothetical protein